MWHIPHDWFGVGVDALGIDPHGFGYPRLTDREARQLGRRLDQGKSINPTRMGSEWNHLGPRVCTIQSILSTRTNEVAEVRSKV